MTIEFIYKKSQRYLLLVLLAFSLFVGENAHAQSSDSLHFEYPDLDSIYSGANKVIFGGNATLGGQLYINDHPIKIYKTGSFLYTLENLYKDIDTFHVVYIHEKDTIKKDFFKFPKAQPIQKTLSLGELEYIHFTPENPEWLRPGDIVEVTLKTKSRSKVYFFNSKILLEEQDSTLVGAAGIYKGIYKIAETDTVSAKQLFSGYATFKNKKVIFKNLSKLTILPSNKIILGKTIGNYVSMTFSDGDDRLGAAKMTYLDTAIVASILGKQNHLYKVGLTENNIAYIPENYIRLIDYPTEFPYSLTGNINVYPENNQDIIKVHLDRKILYSSNTEIHPNKLKIQLYGATVNTNWITQAENLNSIANVSIEQTAKDLTTIVIDLKSKVNWGYDIQYVHNDLYIRINHSPKSSEWKDLAIGIDPGHGGSNLGANGLSGVLEKDIALEVALKLSEKLEKLGAHVVLTRKEDTTLSIPQRIDILKKYNPNLVLSIHCNSAGPYTKGNSTYYRYIGFRPLSLHIHKEMLSLGLDNYGNVGNFNFGLNGPTQFINALNELAFISNLDEEEKLIDPKFQAEMADAMINGIEAFLKENVGTEK